MTIGIFVTGSIMSPRIFISTSMRSLPFSFSLHHRDWAVIEHALPYQRMRSGARHADIEIIADTDPSRKAVISALSLACVGKVESPVLRGTPHPLAQGLMTSFDMYLLN